MVNNTDGPNFRDEGVDSVPFLIFAFGGGGSLFSFFLSFCVFFAKLASRWVFFNVVCFVGGWDEGGGGRQTTL